MKPRLTAQSPPGIDPQRLALGIQQPWAELILRGIKTLEIRSLSTNVRGRIYLYASRQLSASPASQNAIDRYQIHVDNLSRGSLVGSVDLVDSCLAVPEDASSACLSPELLIDQYAWRLAAPERFPEPLPVRFLPYGVWFYPYRRRNGRRSR
jgi:hypothetical protein